jgi:hypothetical protein
MQQVFRVALTPRLQNGAIDYLGSGKWRMWLHTPDFVHGTFLLLYSNGTVERVTSTRDEPDIVDVIKE